ncbi:MAG: cytochrome P450 [Actinomycetota bacterium]|nr:cytochrome P450 [Actinomycetota bacterium]
MADSATTLLYDPRDPSVRTDPYPHYQRLRETDPVHKTPFGYWVLTRHRDIDTVLRSPAVTSEFHRDATWAKHRGGSESPVVRDTRRWMLMLDKRAHRRIRGLVNHVFSAKSLERLAPRIADILDGLIDRLGTGDKIDLIKHLALPLPVTVICELVGLPTTDQEICRVWTEKIGHVVDPALTEETQIAMNEAVLEFREYIKGHLLERRRKPREDILSLMLAAEVDGEKLDDEEIIANVLLLFNAGHETSVNLVGNGMLALLRHPDQLAALRANPSLIEDGIDEISRYDAPVQLVARITTKPVEVGDKEIPAGSKVMLLLGAANRDPERYPEPDRLVLDRGDIKSLAFGGGPHYCIGAMLGKIEGRMVFTELLRRYSTLELAVDDVVWRPHVNFRGLTELPMTLKH